MESGLDRDFGESDMAKMCFAVAPNHSSTFSFSCCLSKQGADSSLLEVAHWLWINTTYLMERELENTIELWTDW